MPRRLDPKKGLPGLFAPGRPKAAEMSFLVEATPPRPRKRAPKAEPAPAPIAPPTPVPAAAPLPIPDYIALAPAFRAVPMLPPEPVPIRLSEIPALLSCALGWALSAFRTTG
jgi:hypothetical protein